MISNNSELQDLELERNEMMKNLKNINDEIKRLTLQRNHILEQRALKESKQTPKHITREWDGYDNEGNPQF